MGMRIVAVVVAVYLILFIWGSIAVHEASKNVHILPIEGE